MNSVLKLVRKNKLDNFTYHLSCALLGWQGETACDRFNSLVAPSGHGCSASCQLTSRWVCRRAKYGGWNREPAGTICRRRKLEDGFRLQNQILLLPNLISASLSGLAFMIKVFTLLVFGCLQLMINFVINLFGLWWFPTELQLMRMFVRDFYFTVIRIWTNWL